jgi:hypothetical protein
MRPTGEEVTQEIIGRAGGGCKREVGIVDQPKSNGVRSGSCGRDAARFRLGGQCHRQRDQDGRHIDLAERCLEQGPLAGPHHAGVVFDRGSNARAGSGRSRREDLLPCS